MTKEAIDLNGKLINVPLETPVIRKRGQNYILNADEQADYNNRQLTFEQNKPLRDLEKVIKNRIKEYGTPEEQLHYLVENGVDALKQRNLQIKANNPKPVKK